jgi:acid phosphatase type 7
MSVHFLPLVQHAQKTVDNGMYGSVSLPGVAHIIQLTSYVFNSTFEKHEKMYKWLEADLKKVDRTKTPWLIVLFHDPWYSTDE